LTEMVTSGGEHNTEGGGITVPETAVRVFVDPGAGVRMEGRLGGGSALRKATSGIISRGRGQWGAQWQRGAAAGGLNGKPEGAPGERRNSAVRRNGAMH